MFTTYAGYSVVATLQPGKAKRAKVILRRWSCKTCGNTKEMFSLCPSILFVSGSVLCQQPYRTGSLPETLLLLTSYTGPGKKHIEELIRYYGTELRSLFQYCLNYPEKAETDDAYLKSFIVSHKHPDVFFSGIKDAPCSDFAREENLRREILDFLHKSDAANSFKDCSASEIRGKIQGHIKAKLEEFSWAQNEVHLSFLDRCRMYKSWIQLVPMLVFLATIGFILYNAPEAISWPVVILVSGSILTFLFLLFRDEMKCEEDDENFVTEEHLQEIMATQIQPVINEVTIAGPLKNGWVRRKICMIILKIASLSLGLTGKNIPTIATARWLSINNGKRLVFISNFTNMAESYVRDFIDCRRSALKINFIFGSGKGYPKTRYFLFSGALDYPEKFMNVFQLNQHPTEFWYWRYQHLNLSVDNINKNHKIRVGLFAKKTEKKVSQWLRLL